MSANHMLSDLTRFFKAARHLWGRCPCCGEVFRLSDAAISFGSTPPRDWLQRLQRQQSQLDARTSVIEERTTEVEDRETDVRDREREVARLDRDLLVKAREIAKDMARNGKGMRELLREERQQAVQRSRSTLLGKLFERLGPVVQKLGHDPRDMRPVMDPIDFVVFQGLTLNRRVERITFLEVKSGMGRPSSCQRSIAQAVNAGRVDVHTLQVGAKDVPLALQLMPSRSEPA